MDGARCTFAATGATRAWAWCRTALQPSIRAKMISTVRTSVIPRLHREPEKGRVISAGPLSRGATTGGLVPTATTRCDREESAVVVRAAYHHGTVSTTTLRAPA